MMSTSFQTVSPEQRKRYSPQVRREDIKTENGGKGKGNPIRMRGNQPHERGRKISIKLKLRRIKTKSTHLLTYLQKR